MTVQLKTSIVFYSFYWWSLFFGTFSI